MANKQTLKKKRQRARQRHRDMLIANQTLMSYHKEKLVEQTFEIHDIDLSELSSRACYVWRKHGDAILVALDRYAGIKQDTDTFITLFGIEKYKESTVLSEYNEAYQGAIKHEVRARVDKMLQHEIVYYLRSYRSELVAIILSGAIRAHN